MRISQSDAGGKGSRPVFWAGALLATLALASFVGRPAGPEVIALLQWDKVLHFFVFGLQATLVCRAVGGRRSGLMGALVTIAYGLLDETLQAVNPERVGDPWDLLADALGATVGVTVYRLWPWYRNLLETPLFRR